MKPLNHSRSTMWSLQECWALYLKQPRADFLKKLFHERELGYGTARGRQGGDSGEETVEAFMASDLACWWSEGLELSQSSMQITGSVQSCQKRLVTENDEFDAV